TLEYDDVMNKQREVIYGFRNEIIHAPEVRERLMDIMEEVVISKVEQYTTAEFDEEQWKIRALADWVNLNFPLGLPEAQIIKAAQAGVESPPADSIYNGFSPAQYAVCTFITQKVDEAYQLKAKFENPDAI